MPPPATDRFIESWGTMGALWGINRSIARIHGLLLTSDEPLQLDQIADRLAISRGNVSMSLKELAMWGVVRRANLPGDRRDYFSAEPDVWSMLFKIARERKRREFDPALTSLREMLKAPDCPLGAAPRARLGELEEILATIDRVLDAVLGDEQKGRSLFGFFTDLILRGR